MTPARPPRPRTGGESSPRRGPNRSRPAPGPTRAAKPARASSGGNGGPGGRRPAGREEQPKPPAPTITLRGLGLFIVVLVAFIVLAPTLRHAVEQQEQLRRIDAEVAAAEERNTALEEQIHRWDDDDYVKAQARDRLGFVMPGERTYRVIDPETVVGEEPDVDDLDDVLPVVDDAPWYLRVWDSVEVAGETGDDEDAEDSDGEDGDGQDARP